MSLTTTFLIRGVGFDAGEVGVVNKTLGLLATIVGALFGGILMQRLSLFRALMIFGILQGASNAGYWLLSVTDKHLYSMGAAVFFENLCGGMGTSAFVALLMTLCNKSFSATQFALLSALSAVGRVYVGPVAGWFVEAHGWPTFYRSLLPPPYQDLFCCWSADRRWSTRGSMTILSHVPSIHQVMPSPCGHWRRASACWPCGYCC